jgi:hypothetical protein
MEQKEKKQFNQLMWLLYMSLMMWVATRIPVNRANRLDQHSEIVLAAKPAIQLVCSTKLMCHIGIALEYTA